MGWARVGWERLQPFFFGIQMNFLKKLERGRSEYLDQFS